MRVTERVRRIDFRHMEVQFTFNNRGPFTRPWSAAEHLQLLLDTGVLEYICETRRGCRHSRRPRPNVLW